MEIFSLNLLAVEMALTYFDVVTQYFIVFLSKIALSYLDMFLRSFILLNLLGLTKYKNENMINKFCC